MGDLSATVEIYINRLSSTFNLDKSDLEKIWEQFKQGNLRTPPGNNVTYTAQELNKMKVSQLKDICGSLSLTKNGTKSFLVNRILGIDGATPTTRVALATPSKKKTSKVPKRTTIIDTIKHQIPDVVISKNKYGNWMHESGLVFDRETSNVIGRQMEPKNSDSEPYIATLCVDDIEICKANNFLHVMPLNLNT